MTDSSNAQAALIAASRAIKHTSITRYPEASRSGANATTTNYTQTLPASEVLELAATYLRWLNEAEKGTIEERVTRLEETS